MLLARAPHEPPYEFAFEFKYVRKEEAHKAPAVLQEGKAQLRGYLSAEEWRGRPNLKGYVVVFVYDALFAAEEV
jgi:L-amino acid N-acyltransferase YncA